MRPSSALSHAAAPAAFTVNVKLRLAEMKALWPASNTSVIGAPEL